MSWDALRDKDSGRPRRSDEAKIRGSRRPNPSSRPPAGLISQNPRARSLRARSAAPAQPLPAVVEEELWFGGHDPTVAEDTAARSMAALVGRIVGAKPFPESARRLAELTRKDVIRIEPIIQVLERDPALSARLLRLVNSAGYALRQRCTSVRHAATLVGTDRLHQIATTAAVLDLFDSRGPIAARIVEHSTIVGAFCRYLGAHLALPVDDLFTAGFLHDIGKLMLLETEGDQYVELLEKYADQPDAIHLAERSLYGFDHAVLAAHVLNAWNIPDPVPKIVAWHHDPTRAYRISSMMAALVQTVRLADAAVYAMVRGVSQEEFATLATAESASYLDISEPQLASMWDELQTLYRESVEQCRGENAPALDPRSLRPKQPLSMTAGQEQPRSAELPLQFPCVVCGGPTFGNTCCACGGHMCPEHQVGREDWCTLCSRDYQHEESIVPSAMSPRIAIVIAAATVLVSVAFGYETGGTVGGVRAGVGTAMLLTLAAVLAVIGRRLLLRFRFIRSRPNRNIVDALENDGGVQSLVPPTLDGSMPRGDGTRDPLSEHIRLSGAMLERVMIRDVPSIPAIIAPLPFDGLRGASLRSAASAVDEAALELPTAPRVARQTFDAERVLAQSMSLVTLPAPASPHASDQHPETSSEPAPISHLMHGDMSNASGAATERLGVQKPLEAIRPDPINEVMSLEGAPVAEPQREALRTSEPSREALSASGPGREATLALGADCDEPTKMAAHEVRRVASPPTADSVSVHPLAALGLQPERTKKVSPPAGVEGIPLPAQQTSSTPAHEGVERITLLGLTAEALIDGAASSPASLEPIPLEPMQTPLERGDMPSPNETELQAAVHADVKDATAHGSEEVESPAVPAADRVVPLASLLKSEPPPAPRATPIPNVGPEELIQPLAAALGPEILSKFGPEFQTRVMELVAERVAAAVAQQMLQSFGQPAAPASRSKAARVPLVKVTDSDPPDGVGPVKRQRKRVAKH